MLRHSTPITPETPRGGDLSAVSRLRALVEAGAAPTITPAAEAAILGGQDGAIVVSWEAGVELESNRYAADNQGAVALWSHRLVTTTLVDGDTIASTYQPSAPWRSQRRVAELRPAVADVSAADESHLVYVETDSLEPTLRPGEEAHPVYLATRNRPGGAVEDTYLGDTCRSTVIGAASSDVTGWTATAGTVASGTRAESPAGGRAITWGSSAAGSVLSAPLSPCAYATTLARPVTLSAYLAGFVGGQTYRARLLLTDAAGATVATVTGPVWAPPALAAGTPMPRFVATVEVPAIPGDTVRQMRWQLEHVVGTDGVHVAAPELYAGHDRGPLRGLTAAVPRLGGGLMLSGRFVNAAGDFVRREVNRVDIHGDALAGHVTAASVYSNSALTDAVPTALASAASGGRLSIPCDALPLGESGVVIRVEETSSGDGGDVWLTQVDAQYVLDVSARVIEAEVEAVRESGEPGDVGSFLTSTCALTLDNTDRALSPLLVESIDEGHRLELAARIHYGQEEPEPSAFLETRRNLAPNPRPASVTGYTGGNATLAVSADRLQVTPSGVNADSYAAVGSGLLPLGLEPGRAYTFSATVRTPVAQSGALSARARRWVVFHRIGGAAYTEVPGPQGPTTGSERLSHTIAFPAGTTEILLRLYNGATNAAANVVEWHSLTIEESGTVGDYFDGSRPADADTSGLDYAWTGTVDNSPSVQRQQVGGRVLTGRNGATNPRPTFSGALIEIRRNLVRNPAVGVDLFDLGFSFPAGQGTVAQSRLTTEGEDGGPFRRLTYTAAATTVGGSAIVGTGSSDAMPVTAGQPYSARIGYRTSREHVARLGIDWYSAAGAYVSTSAAPPSLVPAGVWTELALLNVNAPTGATRAVMVAGPRPDARSPLGQVGDTIDTDGHFLELASALLGYFDGATPPALEMTPVWLGTAHASGSRMLAPRSDGWSYFTGSAPGYLSMMLGEPTAAVLVRVAQHNASVIPSFGATVQPRTPPGQVSRVAVDVWSPVATTARITHRYERPGGVYLTDTAGPTYAIPAGEWTTVEHTDTAPETSFSMAARVVMGAGIPAGSVVHFRRAVNGKATEVAGPYFDGDTVDPSGRVRYGWAGAPYANLVASTRALEGPIVERVEAVPVGTFYSDAWDAPSDTNVATIEGRDLLGRSSGADVLEAVQVNLRPEELVRDLARRHLDLDVDDLDLRVPSSYVIPYGYATGTLGTYLAGLALSVGAVIGVDRLGRLAVVQRDQEGAVSLAEFTGENALLRAGTPLSVDSLRTIVTVKASPLVAGPPTELYASTSTTVVPVGTIYPATPAVRLFLPYSTVPAVGVTLSSFLFTPPYNPANFEDDLEETLVPFSGFADLRVVNPALFGVERTITDVRLTGTPLVEAPLAASAEQPAGIARYGRRELEVVAPFVQTAGQALSLASAILDLYSGVDASGRRVPPVVTFDALGLLLSEPGDLVTLSEPSIGVAGEHRLTGHRLSYGLDGLRSTGTARRDVAELLAVADVHLADDVAVLSF